tara:strand:+ start:223 stop:768 length:546 start_codon:yes stop_codon:yes gene_type:complete
MYTVSNTDELDEIIIENKDKLVLLYFGASWCGPCHKLKDKLKDEKLMSNFPELCCIYIDIDNDEFSELCEKYDVQSLPTQFITVLKNNSVKRLDKIIGYNWNGLINSYIKNVQLLKNDQEIKKNNQNSKSNDENNDKNNDENNDKNNDISKDESSRESDDMDSDEESDENNDKSNNNHDDD